MLQDGDALSTVKWWLGSSPFVNGVATGPPEWPLEGGYLGQPAKLVEAVELLRSEWSYVLEASSDRRKEPVRAAAEGAQRVRRKRG